MFSLFQNPVHVKHSILPGHVLFAFVYPGSISRPPIRLAALSLKCVKPQLLRDPVISVSA